MLCPNCFNERIKCIDSRKDIDAIIRRRECCECGFKWQTIEIDEDLYKSILGSRQNNVYTEDIN